MIHLLWYEVLNHMLFNSGCIESLHLLLIYKSGNLYCHSVSCVWMRQSLSQLSRLNRDYNGESVRGGVFQSWLPWLGKTIWNSTGESINGISRRNWFLSIDFDSYIYIYNKYVVDHFAVGAFIISGALVWMRHCVIFQNYSRFMAVVTYWWVLSAPHLCFHERTFNI